MEPHKPKFLLSGVLLVFALSLSAVGVSKPPEDLVPIPISNQSPTPYAAWTNGFGDQTDYFPIAVWLQNPSRAHLYKALGINLYMGLWQGPTEWQISALRAQNMPIICEMNEYAREHLLDDPIVVAWLHIDEPDNAKSFPSFWNNDPDLVAEAWPQYAGWSWGTWGPPASPSQVTNWYREIKNYDKSRPVIGTFGQAVAWDDWHGRGVRTRHPEDYSEYAKGVDIINFDIYPVVSSYPQVTDALWRVPYGVKRLREWSEEKITWNCIECTHINNANKKATPAQVRSEVWMSIIFGSRGLVYFVHQFSPTFIEPALLEDPEMMEAVTTINNQIHGLAAVINRPSISGKVEVNSSNPTTPVCAMVKYYKGYMYIFSAAMHNETTSVAFDVADIESSVEVEVLGEGRTIPAMGGLFFDEFSANDVHIYKVALKESGIAVLLR